jgi:hypothetical protein
MTKLRSDAIWNTLTPEQREKIEEWLLDKNLGYKETHKRAQRELGLGCSMSTIRRFRVYARQLRAIEETAEAEGMADELKAVGGRLENLRSSGMKLIVVRLLGKAMDRGDVREVAALGQLMIRDEEREIQRDRVTLARDRFEFKAVKAALKAVPLLGQINQTGDEEEAVRAEAVRRALFGKPPEEPK